MKLLTKSGKLLKFCAYPTGTWSFCCMSSSEIYLFHLCAITYRARYEDMKVNNANRKRKNFEYVMDFVDNSQNPLFLHKSNN